MSFAAWIWISGCASMLFICSSEPFPYIVDCFFMVIFGHPITCKVPTLKFPYTNATGPYFLHVLRNRGTSGRSHLNPLGNVHYESVSGGNLIASRTLILLYICAALQCWWVLEQPVNSFMQELPAFKHFMKQVKTYRQSICMRDYGGPTLKPTWLYSGSLLLKDKLLENPQMESHIISNTLTSIEYILHTLVDPRYGLPTIGVFHLRGLFFSPQKSWSPQKLLRFEWKYTPLHFRGSVVFGTCLLPIQGRKRLSTYTASNLCHTSSQSMMM